MDASEIKQIAERCERIDDFVHERDDWGNAEISTGRNPAAMKNLDTTTSREVWPDFRKQLIALYNELAASINADVFFDPKETNDE